LRQRPQVITLPFALSAQLLRSILPFGGKAEKNKKESIPNRSSLLNLPFFSLLNYIVWPY
jgi:hypothetical protein